MSCGLMALKGFRGPISRCNKPGCWHPSSNQRLEADRMSATLYAMLLPSGATLNRVAGEKSVRGAKFAPSPRRSLVVRVARSNENRVKCSPSSRMPYSCLPSFEKVSNPETGLLFHVGFRRRSCIYHGTPGLNSEEVPVVIWSAPSESVSASQR